MGPILIQAVGFLLVILVAYLFKKRGMLKEQDGHILSKMIVYITLPAAIIVGFNGVAVNATFFLMIFLGFFSNVVLVILGGVLWRKKSAVDQSLLMFGISGYNIGNFTMPFVQGFFPAAVPFIGSFDMGNSLMLAGGTTVAVEKMTGQNKEVLSLVRTLQKLLSSPPFTTYLIMLILALTGITLPDSVLNIVHLFSNANAFLSMFMIGLYLELQIDRSSLTTVAKILGFRYVCGAVLAAAFYFLLPLPQIVRTILVLLAFAPFASLSTINAIIFGNKPTRVGFLSSASIIISLLLMTSILLFL